MPITLLDEIALETDTLRKGILMSLAETSAVNGRIPFESVGALQTSVTYLSGIPTVPLRHINETPASVSATLDQRTEVLHILDTDIDIDPVLLNNKNQVQPVDVMQTKAVMASIGYRQTGLMVNGDPASDLREPVGIKVRLRDNSLFANMTVNATANTVEADFTPSATDAERIIVLNKLDELMYLLEDKVSFLLTSRQMVMAFWGALRAAKLLDTTKDQFDRTITMYRGVPLLDAGFNVAAALTASPDTAGNDTNQVIGNDADDYSSGNDPGTGNGSNAYTDCTTIYAVRIGSEHCIGLQQEALRVKPYGETPDPPHYFRTNIRWVFNPLVAFQPRALARLCGVASTTTPA